MSSYKSIVKAALFAVLFLSNSLFANTFLISHEKGIDYNLIKSHLSYDSHIVEIDSYFLDLKSDADKFMDKVMPPLYKDEKVLFKLSAKGIREEQKSSSSIDRLVLGTKENIDVRSDSYISFVMRLIF